MKQLYLMYSVVLLLHAGAAAHANAPEASPAGSTYPDSRWSIIDQARSLSGQVTDEGGIPFPGVNVVVKGTTTGTTTDSDGKYALEVPDGNSVLVFSFVGYSVQEVDVAGRTVVDLAMNPDVQSLSEVVVTALGIKKESKKLGYATTSVKTDELVKNRTNNMMESLEGRVAGLNISPPAAGAGASTQIRLRGQVGFNGATNSPLIVINGLPLDQGARSANGAEQRDRGDNLMNLNPDDIESMTILKGSTAAALYGSRAQAGAIMITTKSGSRNQNFGVEFTSSYTVQEPLNFFDLQKEFGQGQAGVRPGGTLPNGSTLSAVSTGQFAWGERYDGVPTPIFDGSLQPYSAQPDHLFEYLRNGKNFTNTVALSGGDAKGSFRASFSNTDASGIEPRNEYKRKVANVGLTRDITKKLNLSLNINYAKEHQINPPQIGQQGAGSVNFFTRIANSIPHSALKNSAIAANGTEAVTSGFQGTLLNPYYANAMNQKWTNERDRILSTVTLRYNLTDWLYVQGRYNYDYTNDFTESNVPGGQGTSVPTNADNTFKGQYNISEGRGTDVNADFLVGANKEFGKFSVDASFGGNTWRVEDHTFNQGASSFIVRDFYTIGNGTVRTQSFGYGKRRTNSLYALAEFGYNDLVYINFTGREDWFSVYNPKKNKVFYPSVSGSFVFSELLQSQTWLSYGKLRGSWAQVGSANGVNTYEGLLTYDIAQNAFNGQTTASIGGAGTSPNPNLQPFKVTEKEIGLELRLFNNKLHVDLAAFDKLTEDQVLPVTLSNTSGYTSSKENLGSLRNRGFETQIEYTPVQTGNLTWTTSWNNAYLSTEVLAIAPGVNDFLVINFNTTGNEFLGQLRYTVGLPMNQLYTRTYLRDAEGNILVTDPSGVVGTPSYNPGGNLIATADYIPVGSSIPKYTGGWNNTVTFKNLSIGILIDYKFGGTVLSSTALNLLRQGHSKESLVGRRVGEEGLTFPGVYQNSGLPNTSVLNGQRLQDFYGNYRNQQIGDPFIFKSDFIKLRTISLAYNLTNALRKVDFLGFVNGLTLSASVRNVAILYKDIPNLDPEAIQSSGDQRAGYENASLPTTRNYNVSLNVKF